MDITTMFNLLGLFDSDDEEAEEKGIKSMTDQQFRAFIRMCHVLASSADSVKNFRDRLKWAGCMGAEGTHSIFGNMLVQIAEATGDLEKVRQILQETLDGLRT